MLHRKGSRMCRLPGPMLAHTSKAMPVVSKASLHPEWLGIQFDWLKPIIYVSTPTPINIPNKRE